MPQRHEQSDNILVRLTGKQVYLAKRRLIDEGNSLLRNFSIEIRKREADSRGLPSARLILVTFICATVTISERRFDKEKHDSARKQGEETRKMKVMELSVVITRKLYHSSFLRVR